MAIPRSAYPAPFNTTRASHVVLTVKDLGRSHAFYCDALGFAVSDRDGGALYLRGRVKGSDDDISSAKDYEPYIGDEFAGYGVK